MPRIARDPSSTRDDGGMPSPTRPKRNLKRSASQTSLLTPPRTVKRDKKRRSAKHNGASVSKRRSRSRSRSRVSGHETELEASDAEEVVSLGDGAGRRLDFESFSKRHRKKDLDARLETLLESLEGEDAENPFWVGPSKVKAGSSESASKDAKSDVKSDSDKAKKSVRVRSPSPPLLSFRGKAPVSPPPSNRRRKKVAETVVEEVVETVVDAKVESEVEATPEPPIESTGESQVEPAGGVPVDPTGPEDKSPAEPSDDLPVVNLPPMPSTPKKGKGRTLEPLPIRDSPNNPFLDDSPSSVKGEAAEPRTPVTHEEKETLTYVFRGVRAQFANPMRNLPPEVQEHSLLPIEHPDFSPNPACPPKILFPEARRRRASPSPTRNGKSKAEVQPKLAGTSGHSGNEWDDSDDEAELHLSPPKRLFH